MTLASSLEDSSNKDLHTHSVLAKSRMQFHHKILSLFNLKNNENIPAKFKNEIIKS